MDEPLPLPVDNEGLQEAVKAANQLLDDAHRRNAIPMQAAPLLEVGRKGDNENAMQVAYPVAAAERLQFANKTAAQVSNQFRDLDSSDNKFLGKHELEAAAKTIPASQLLLTHLNEITPLYYDHLNAYKSTISQDYLGISQGDLSGLKAVTSSNYDDLKSFARSQVFNTLPGEAGLLIGGVTAATSVVTGAIGLLRIRSGLAGLGIGLGIIGAGAVIGYYSEKNQLDGLRNKLSNDSTLDPLIIKSRYKQIEQ